jgi:TPR repeat protein
VVDNARYSPIGELLEEARGRLGALAATGDGAAAGLLAALHAAGATLPGGDAEALRLAELAAARGDILGLRVMAQRRAAGDGVPEDAAGAAAAWRAAAAAGDAFAMDRLAAALLAGEGVRRDPAEAVRWLEKAVARSGHWWALTNLCHYLVEGWQGDSPDPQRAERWMREWSSRGSAEARGWLAYHGLDGQGAPQ